MQIIAWHTITTPRETEEETRQAYTQVLQNGVLLPWSHRDSARQYYGPELRRNPIFNIDCLAGDDDYVFLSLKPITSNNYFPASNQPCVTITKGPYDTRYYGACPIYSGLSVSPVKRPLNSCYALGFDATDLIAQGAQVGKHDLIDDYHAVVKQEISTVGFLYERVKLGLNYLYEPEYAAYPADQETLRVILQMLRDFNLELAVQTYTGNAQIAEYLKYLRTKLQQIQDRNRLSGAEAQSHLANIAAVCDNQWQAWVKQPPEESGWSSKDKCNAFNSAEILFPGPLATGQALYYIEAGIVYHRDGRQISQL